ncbi:MAG: hypothetical protein WB493_15240 [Anaeromyxobacteraceae bacterium]
MTLPRLAVLAAASAVLACATPSGAPVPVTTPAPGETRPRDFQPTGEVFFDAQGSGTSVAFSDFRMVGPRVNMTRADDGSWRGNVGDREMILKVQPGRITGDGVDLYVVKKVGATTTVSVQGMYFQRQVWFTFKAGEIQGTTDGGRCSFDLNPGQAPGYWTGGVGCGGSMRMGTLQLTGTAANLAEPPLPQLVLALVAVLP